MATLIGASSFAAVLCLPAEAGAVKLKNGAYVRDVIQIPQPNNPGFFININANVGFLVTDSGKIRSGGGFLQFANGKDVCTSKQVASYRTTLTDPETSQQETAITLGVNFAPKKAIRPKRNGSFKVKAVKSKYYPSLTATAYGKLKGPNLASFTMTAGVNGQVIRNGKTKNVRCKAKQTFGKAAWTSDKGIASNRSLTRLIRSFP